MKTEFEENKTKGSICPHGNDKGLCRACPFISINELNKAIEQVKTEAQKELLEWFDREGKHDRAGSVNILVMPEHKLDTKKKEAVR